MGLPPKITLDLWDSLSVSGKQQALQQMTVYLSDQELRQCIKRLNSENSRNADFVMGVWTSLGITERYSQHLYRVICDILEEEDDC